MPLARKLALSALVIGLTGVLVSAVTFSAFSSVAQNPSNRVVAGTVAIADNDANGALLSLADAMPGDSSTGCIQTTFTGSLDSEVRLYGAHSGALAPFLTLTVTRGSDATPNFKSCAGFSADATNYIGQGAGVIYRGPLDGYPGSASAIVDSNGAGPETWTTNEAHSYRFVITLNNNVAAENQSATASFTWEATNK